ncbi:MAG: hypothetical protein KGL95_12955 [Patescibacteria group bacterium]|nr:hypothetical protein [Patescibacteria group bacterium]
MSFFTELQGKVEHEYFQAGPGKKIYLGRKDRPQTARPENIRKALEYVNKKNRHYFEVMDKLLSRLPQQDKDRILQEIIDDLYKMAEKRISSLSPALTKKYKKKG